MGTGSNGSRKVAILALATTAMVLIAAIGLALSFGVGDYTTSWGEDIDKSEWYVIIEGETLTQDDLDYLASLRRVEYIELRNCDVAECRLPELTFASKKLRSLDLTGTTGLWDYSFLKNLQAKELYLSNCTSFDDLSQLNLNVLERLSIDGTGVTDLTALKGSNLRSLDFSYTAVSDITPLAGLEELSSINGSYSKVSSIDALASKELLWGLTFDGCPIERISKPFVAEYLGDLSLANTAVSDLSAFSDCESIDTLNLSGCQNVQSMDWLSRHNRKTLTDLNLAGTGLAADDLAWVGKCTSLRTLALDGIELGTLDMCKDLAELQELSVLGCGITDVSGIKNCRELQIMLLGYNQIANIEDIPVQKEDWPRTFLDLSHNGLTNVSKLPKGLYRCIMLHGNGSEVGRTIPAGITSYAVVLPWFSGIDDSRLADYDDYSSLVVLDAPEDKRRAVEETLGSYRLTWADEETLLQLMEDEELSYVYEDMSGYVAYARAHATPADGAEATE